MSFSTEQFRQTRSVGVVKMRNKFKHIINHCITTAVSESLKTLVFGQRDQYAVKNHHFKLCTRNPLAYDLLVFSNIEFRQIAVALL